MAKNNKTKTNAKTSKKVELPFDKTNEIKPLVVYFAIVDQTNGNAVAEIFKRAGSSVQFTQRARGTASRHVLNILGIEDNRKEIVISLIKKENLKEAVTELKAFYAVSKRNKGIGFSISLTALAGVRMYQFLTDMF
ncbi:MAG TPA: hypothetical protein GX010_00015 [Erysipelotrichaceae bacterium]|nr:hypothetical protein [Erysipelotrichaceae bacterium]